MEKLDIINLINKNPLENLSEKENTKMASRILEVFTTDFQKLFASSYYCYLKYDKKTDFVIKLSDIWEWLGFTRISTAKRLLCNNFTKNVDYIIEKAINLSPFGEKKNDKPLEGENLASPNCEARKKPHGGSNKEDITLTIHCFKKLCLKAQTTKADEIHDYYLELEEILQKTIQEEAREARELLTIKDKAIDEKNLQLENQKLQLENKNLLVNSQKLQLENQKLQLENQNLLLKQKDDVIEQKDEVIEQKDEVIGQKVVKLDCIFTEREQGIIETFKNKRTIYFGLTEKNIVKFGFSDNIKKRLNDHKKEISSDFTFSYVYESRLNREIEKKIKNDFKEIRLSKSYNGKLQTELIQLSEDYTLEDFHQSILKIKYELEDIDNKTKDQKIYALTEENEELKKQREFIARDLETGKEIIFNSYAKAYDISSIGPHSLKDNYLDKPKQSRGWTFRTMGKPYWQPPKNFKYNTAFKPSIHMRMCKSVNIKSGEVTYYNSCIEAAYFIKLYPDEASDKKKETQRRKLTRAMSGKKCIDPIISQYEWSFIETCGEWIS